MPRFHVERSIQIDAAPERAFETVADFTTWPTWSPWLHCDPNAKVDIDDNASSVGSTYRWEGELVGTGEIEHTHLAPGKRIEEEIRFKQPFKSTSHVFFAFEQAGAATRVTWGMDGRLPWFLFWLRPQMEALIAMDYDRGLRMLKAWIETGRVASKTTIKGVQIIGPLRLVGVRGSCTLHDAGSSMETALTQATTRVRSQQIATEGQMLTVYHDFNLKTQVLDYTSGFAVAALPQDPDGLTCWETPETQALRVDHVGRYDHLGNAWSAANQYVRYKKLKQRKGGAFELYKNTPDKTDPTDLVTEVYLPLR